MIFRNVLKKLQYIFDNWLDPGNIKLYNCKSKFIILKEEN